MSDSIREQLISKISNIETSELVEMFSIDIDQIVLDTISNLSDEDILEKIM